MFQTTNQNVFSCLFRPFLSYVRSTGASVLPASQGRFSTTRLIWGKWSATAQGRASQTGVTPGLTTVASHG